MRFLAIFLSLVTRIDLISPLMIVPGVCHNGPIDLGHAVKKSEKSKISKKSKSIDQVKDD